MDDRRRLSFGGVAELYDRARPSYPEALVDDVLEFAGDGAGARSGSGDRVLDVGAGTGKATLLFAERGLDVVALEPSAEMAAVARRNCAKYANVTVEQIEFERWRPSERRFRVLVSGQAWHWIAPEVRYSAARAALEAGGALAPFWNIPDWDACALRDELREAYRRSGEGDGIADPFRPSAQPGHDHWLEEIAASSDFDGAQERHYHWRSTYTTQRYIDLLATQSANLVMEAAQRERFMSDIAGVIDAHGGELELTYVTQLCLARAT
jgi:SAM-dependent methyltransferase